MRPPTMRAIITALALIATGSLTAVATPAVADPDQTIVAETSPMGQVNGRVWTMVHGNGVLYVGGEFTSSRPAGSPAGSGETPRARLAAFNSKTGVLTSLNVTFDDIVRGLDLSPDGKTLYVAGKFRNANDGSTTVAQARGRGAAIDIATGKLTTWNPKLGDTAWSVDATASAVYVGGSFGAANGQPRSRLAALAPVSGTTVLPWAPKADGYVRTLKVAPSGSRIVVGGGFNNLNDLPMRAFGVVDLAGKNVPEFANSQILPDYRPDPTTGGCCYTEAAGLSTDADGNMYVAAEGTGGGRFDGSVKFDPETGAVLWRDNCLGATQMVLPLNGAVYKASHAHDCSQNEGGFPEVRNISPAYHLLALNQQTGAVLHWYPAINGGQGLGPRVFATDGTQLFVGGEFTQAGNKPQQALARFGTALPSSLPRRPATPAASVCPDGVQVRFPATWDPDDATLAYDVFRNSATGTPIATLSQESRPYSLPALEVLDPNPLATGQSVKYVVRASDNRGSVSTSAPSAAVVGGPVANSYPTAVSCDGAEYYWRLADTGTTAADSSPDGTDTGTYTAGATSGATGVLEGNASASFNGTDGAVIGNKAGTGPQDFTVEAWVKTTSTTGGKVIGFGNANAGLSGNYDRHIYLSNAGQAIFGIWDGGAKTIMSSAKVNDGQWHHLVGSKTGSILTFYIDGVAVGSRSDSGPAQGYSGYWRVGGDNLGGWPSQPASNYLKADIDEVAVYAQALDANAVKNHYTLSGNVVAPPPPPPPAPTSCPTDQYLAEYYNSMAPGGQAVLIQCEAVIDNDWGSGSPAPEVNADQFSVRWTGDRDLAAGSYVFETVSDDGIRVDVDGVRVIDNWTDHGPTTDTTTVPLSAGTHRVVVEYYENGGGAVARLAIRPTP